MARLTLDIRNDVRIDFPHTIASVERIDSCCRRLIIGCDSVLDKAHALGTKMQTEANDSTQFSLGQTTDDLEIISRELRDLQESAQDLVRKLKRLEQIAR